MVNVTNWIREVLIRNKLSRLVGAGLTQITNTKSVKATMHLQDQDKSGRKTELERLVTKRL